MKKINNYSAQYKIISEQLHNQNQNHGKIQQSHIRKNYQKIGKNL